MATATCEYDPNQEPYPISLKELLNLPKEETISDFYQYNTSQNRLSMRIIKDMAKYGERFTIGAWNSDDGKMYPFFLNTGHAPGIDAKFFLNEMKKHGSKTLSDELLRLSPD